MIAPARIINIQQRMRELGRIRIGIKGDKKEPKKLNSFRFTSFDKHAIEVAASVYGGKVKQCDAVKSPDLKGQWEVVTDACEIPIYPSPVPISQAYELWSGGGCQRRCDGCTELLSGNPCMCDPDALECKPTTRLSVILPDLPDIGVWRLESHGWNAATELTQTYDWLKGIIGSGRVIEAILAIEERTSRKDGQTRRFMVPVIRIRQTPRELLASMNSAAEMPVPNAAPLPSAPALPAHPDHVLKDPNPRGGVFALLKEMGLPEHEGKAKQIYYDVFGARLKRDLVSLSDLSEDDWRDLWSWLLQVRERSVEKWPPAFHQWKEGKHALQQHDPMAEEDPDLDNRKDIFE